MAQSYAIELKGMSSLIAKIDKLNGLNVIPAVGKGLAIVKSHATSNVAVDTGDLSSNIASEVKFQGNKIIGRVFTNLEYAPFVEFGTGATGNGTYPHPVKGLSLSYRSTPWGFIDEKTGEYIWTNGQVAQPFLYPALNSNEAQIKKIFKEEVANIIQRSIR
jgi:HK97 gp10 family phage protein